MIYFDNAATGGFKPRAVSDACNTVIRFLSANPGRSGHRLAVSGAEITYNCRKELACFFNGVTEKCIFTKNCTEALNLAIFGSLKEGGHVITTVFEHNSVLRPLYHLQSQGKISLDVVAPEKDTPLDKVIERAVTEKTYLIVTTAVSNVTGESLPVKEIGEVAKKHRLLYLVDGAQGGGHLPLDMKKCNINLLALAPHKGLYGVMGLGVLMIDENTDVLPTTFGGTGVQTMDLTQPNCYPERLEAGTLNLPAIAGLLEGVNLVKENLLNFSVHLKEYTHSLIEGLSKIERVKCYSKPNVSGIVSFSIEGLQSTDVADLLNTNYDVAVRGGLHCAPLIHKFLNTEENGLVRASLAVQNSSREIHFFINAIKSICES